MISTGPQFMAPQTLGEGRYLDVHDDSRHSSYYNPSFTVLSVSTAPDYSESVTLLKNYAGTGKYSASDFSSSLAELRRLTADHATISGEQLAERGFHVATVRPGNASNSFHTILQIENLGTEGAAPALTFNWQGKSMLITELKGFGETIRANIQAT